MAMQMTCKFSPAVRQGHLNSVAATLKNAAKLCLICSLKKLNANPSKFKFIIYGTQQQHKIIPAQLKSIPMGGIPMTIDENLTWEDHISQLRGTYAGRLIQLSNVRGPMGKEIFKNAVNTIFILKIKYGDIICVSSSGINLQKVQQIQNFAARVIQNASRRHHTFELMRELD